jgi:hypothetical protein
MKTVTTTKEYQICIGTVLKTKMSMKVKVNFKDKEFEKARKELNMKGVEINVYDDYDEIKPL